MLQSVHVVLQCLAEIIFLLIFLTLMDFLSLNWNSHQFAPTVSLAYTIGHGWTACLFAITWTGLTANIGEFLIVSNFASKSLYIYSPSKVGHVSPPVPNHLLGSSMLPSFQANNQRMQTLCLNMKAPVKVHWECFSSSVVMQYDHLPPKNKPKIWVVKDL